MIREEDIRPSEIFREYFYLADRDAQGFRCERVRSNECLICGSVMLGTGFTKNGFDYVDCQDCGSFFCNPRPNKEEIFRFYSQSPSAIFWAEKCYPSVMEARRELTIKPKVLELCSLLADKEIMPSTVLDIGSGHGIFAEELRKSMTDVDFICVEPSEVLASDLRRKGFTVVQEAIENVEGVECDLGICLEVFEHSVSPREFIKACKERVRVGGHLFFTTLVGDGLDITVLREDSKAVIPPFHLNFASKDGLRKLCKASGLRVLDMQTPGKLDIDILFKSLSEKSGCQSTRDKIKRLRDILEESGLRTAMQEKVVELQMSSHVAVLCERID